MGVITWDQAVDIGGGRGRLAPAAAASLARVDVAMRSAFGRAADINEAWRSPADADKNYAAYLAYLRDPRNNPWAPIALPGDKSVHCFGYAVDTDDTSDAQMRIWNDHGWYWTVYRDGKLVERWHLEYFPSRDNHRNDPAYSNAKPFEEDDMTPDQASQLSRVDAFIQALGGVDFAKKLVAVELFNGVDGVDLSTPRLRLALDGAIDMRDRYVIDANGDGAKDFDLMQLTRNQIQPKLQDIEDAIDLDALADKIAERLTHGRTA